MGNKNKIPALSLTDIVNQYMMASFNDRRKYYLNYLAIAQWAWKELLRDTIWSVKSKYVQVDKTKLPYSIPFPSDCIRFLNISAVDVCNNLQPMAQDNYMNTLEKPKTKASCSCHKDSGCEDSLCDAIDSITVRMKDIVIDSIVYIEKIWNKRCDNGDLIEIIETPVKKYDGNGDYTVVMDTRERLICQLEVTETGCVLPTPKNIQLVVNNCGCFLTSCLASNCSTDLHKTPNDFGRIKIEDNKIFVDTNEDWVILSYQTNGECNGEEIMVPEIAVDAIMFGIDWRSKALRPNINRYEKAQARIDYNRAKSNLEFFLNPIRIDEFMRVSWQFPVWGSKTMGQKTFINETSIS